MGDGGGLVSYSWRETGWAYNGVMHFINYTMSGP